MNATTAINSLEAASFNFSMVARRDECPNYLPLTTSIRKGCKSYGLRDLLLNSADVRVMQAWADQTGADLNFVFTGSKTWVRCNTPLSAEAFVSLRNFVLEKQRVARTINRRMAYAICAI